MAIASPASSPTPGSRWSSQPAGPVPPAAQGKSDPVDAEAAARAVLAGDATAIPKDRQGPVGALRALVVARRSAVKARTQAANQIHALLLGGNDDLRGRLARRRDRDLAQACSQLPAAGGIELALRSLGRRWQALSKEVAGLDADITKLVKKTAPKLLAEAALPARRRRPHRCPVARHRRL